MCTGRNSLSQTRHSPACPSYEFRVSFGVTVIVHRVILCLAVVGALAGCGGAPSGAASADLARARNSWAGTWHAVWEIEWHDAPVIGPLVAEMWHSADGHLRIETLEAPVAALNGLTLVSTGDEAWLYDVRSNQAQSGTRDLVRVPLADDMLSAMDWLLAETGAASIGKTTRDVLESGPAWQLQVILPSGDEATLWLTEPNGFPAGFALRSGRWGTVRCVTRWLEQPQRLDHRLFDPQPPVGATAVQLPGATTQTAALEQP
jgi:outer membrane lipoprotein-sorting protein